MLLPEDAVVTCYADPNVGDDSFNISNRSTTVPNYGGAINDSTAVVGDTSTPFFTKLRAHKPCSDLSETKPLSDVGDDIVLQHYVAIPKLFGVLGAGTYFLKLGNISCTGVLTVRAPYSRHCDRGYFGLAMTIADGGSPCVSAPSVAHS